MSETVIGVSSVNPHYFTINGEIRLLISSAEHYGALINRAFDFRRYFRCFSSLSYSHLDYF